MIFRRVLLTENAKNVFVKVNNMDEKSIVILRRNLK